MTKLENEELSNYVNTLVLELEDAGFKVLNNSMHSMGHITMYATLGDNAYMILVFPKGRYEIKRV